MATGVGFGAIILMLIFSIYPLLALGRIWLYSKQQVELLEQIRDSLQGRVAPSP